MAAVGQAWPEPPNADIATRPLEPPPPPLLDAALSADTAPDHRKTALRALTGRFVSRTNLHCVALPRLFEVGCLRVGAVPWLWGRSLKAVVSGWWTGG